MNFIEIKNISKSYGELEALKDVSLSVKKGELYGLIGPDGAGKTTLFEILVSLQKPSSGECWIDNLSCLKDADILRKRIGYMPGRFSLYPDLSVYENLNFFASIFGTTIEKGRELIEDIWIQLEPFSDRKASALSGGMKQKLALCCAMIHQPEVLFLDEPTTGVDPVSRKEFWHILNTIKNRGIAILVSTPYMDEAIICDRVSLIQNGKILQTDTPLSIIELFPRTLYSVKTDKVHKLLVRLKECDKVHSCNAFGQSVHFTLKNENTDVKSFIGDGGVFEMIEASIEDCFIELMTTNNGKRN